jgi:hypothetical protein
VPPPQSGKLKRAWEETISGFGCDNQSAGTWFDDSTTRIHSGAFSFQTVWCRCSQEVNRSFVFGRVPFEHRSRLRLRRRVHRRIPGLCFREVLAIRVHIASDEILYTRIAGTGRIPLLRPTIFDMAKFSRFIERFEFRRKLQAITAMAACVVAPHQPCELHQQHRHTRRGRGTRTCSISKCTESPSDDPDAFARKYECLGPITTRSS